MFSSVGTQSLHTTHSMGRTYDATGTPPPLPMLPPRTKPMGGQRNVPGDAHTITALSTGTGPSAGPLTSLQTVAAAAMPRTVMHGR